MGFGWVEGKGVKLYIYFFVELQKSNKIKILGVRQNSLSAAIPAFLFFIGRSPLDRSNRLANPQTPGSRKMRRRERGLFFVDEKLGGREVIHIQGLLRVS